MTDDSDFSAEPRRWLRLIPTIGVAMFSIFLAGFILDVQKTQGAKTMSEPSADFSPLGLKVTSQPQQVQILWNHAASAIHDAATATIRISDGDVSESVPFDGRQLQDGALVYRPRTNDVNIRMEVHEQDGRQVSESLRVVAIP
jgi:hypothetical protein